MDFEKKMVEPQVAEWTLNWSTTSDMARLAQDGRIPFGG
jgi:hypothetical protein